VTIGLGIVGLGTAGAVMLGAAFAHDGVEVAAVADSDGDLAWPCSVGSPRRYDSLGALLADDRVQAVHIATPTPLHDAQVRQALAAGRHVIVEKPVTASLREAEGLTRYAAGVEPVVIVGHSEAFEPYVQATAAVIAAGAIGVPVMVLAEKFTDWMRRPRLPQEWDSASGGGIIRRQGIHQLDVIRTLTGASYQVREARLRTDTGRGVPGGYVAWLDSANGPSAVLTQDGTGRLSAGDGRRAGDGGAETATRPGPAVKQARRAALLHQVLTSRAAPRIGLADRERLIVLGQDGEITATSQRVEVTSAAGTRVIDLAAYPEGRHAVLDELAGAVSGASPVTHGLAWGLESLRTCEDIERAALAAYMALSGSRSALTHSRVRLLASFSKGMVSPTA
jgi:phthalate 4,5-cis-dihydrodiol dehydrogenase